MLIEYWSDYACPFCYIGVENLRSALEEMGIEGEFVLKSFELDPSIGPRKDIPTKERFSHKYGISVEEAQERIDNISRMAEETGIPFNYENVTASNTRDAHRLTKYAYQKDLKTAEELTQRLYHDNFVLNKDLSDLNVLLDAAESVGIDRKEAEDILNSDQFSKEVVQDEIEAARNQIHGVPFFVIDNKVAVPGALDKDNFIESIKTAQSIA